jgi:two-component system phosphate regulon response regulator PhoB
MEMERNPMPGNPMLKISLIEDDPNMASLLSTLLEMEGYTVRLAGNHHVHGLLQTILLERPHIALIDVNLAKGSGLDLVRSIRREPEIKSTCILMTSGLYLEKESLQAGADGFIQKPFMPDELMKLIQDTYQQSTTYQLEKE